jgi:folylpolyglutamate synthase/dihydropteroate synthase
VCIFGSVEGKDTEGMAAEIFGAFKEIIISKPGTFKPNSPEDVARIFRQFNPSSLLLIEAAEALKKAFEISAGTRPILVTGSFYMVAEIRPLLLTKQKSGIMEDI